MTLVSTAARAAGTGGGALTQLAAVTLGANAATIDSGTFATNYNHLLCYTWLRHTTAETINSALVLLNNDAGANYGTQRAIVSGGAASADEGPLNRGLASFGSSATANQFSPGTIFIPNYASSTLLKNALMISGGLHTVASVGWQAFSTLVWNSTAAVNRIVLQAPSNNFVAGSFLYVYGIT